MLDDFIIDDPDAVDPNTCPHENLRWKLWDIICDDCRRVLGNAWE